jgi:hypothetical protein
VEDTIELADIHHGRTVLKATLDGDLDALQQDLVRVRDLLDDEHDRVARDLGVEKNKKLHLENHQVYHYSLRITKAVSLLSSFSSLLPHPIFRVFTLIRSLKPVLYLSTRLVSEENDCHPPSFVRERIADSTGSRSHPKQKRLYRPNNPKIR